MDNQVGVEDLRGELGKRVDVAHFQGEVTVVTKNGEPRAVLVPYDWYREAEARRQSMTVPPGAEAGADLNVSTLPETPSRTGGGLG